MNRVFSTARDTRLTIFQEFAPITLISRVLGVFPITQSNVFGNQIFMTSRAATIYSIVLLGLTFVHLIYIPSMTISSSNFVNLCNNRNYSIEDLKNPLASPALLIRLLNAFAMSLIAIFSRLNAISYVRNNLPNAFSTLNTIDGLLEPKLEQREKNIRAIWILVGLSILVGLPGQITSSIFALEAESYEIGIYTLGNMVNNLTSVSAEAQFVALCCLLKSKFEIINEKLIEFRNFYNLDNDFSTNDRREGVALKRGEVYPDIKFIANKERKFFLDKISVFETIKTLRIGHQRLCDVLDQVNHMFQMQLLFSISGCFLNQLFNTYSFFSGGAWIMQKNDNLDTSLLSSPLINLSWAIYYAIRIIALATISSKTIKVAKRALIHILDVRRSSIDFATKEELNLFYDHVTSRKVQFSAAGFFNLEIALISSVVTTGSTYLVVMVQIR